MMGSSFDRAGRGQTFLDFAVGIAIFLITIAFVSAFVPQLLLPFEDQQQTVVVDRTASTLGNELLTDPATPSELNESSTRTFFNQTEAEAREQLGIEPWYSVNVSLRDVPSRGTESELLCHGSNDEWIDTECTGDSDQFAVGRRVPRDDKSVATARRTVFAGNRTVVLEVNVW